MRWLLVLAGFIVGLMVATIAGAHRSAPVRAIGVLVAAAGLVAVAAGVRDLRLCAPRCAGIRRR